MAKVEFNIPCSDNCEEFSSTNHQPGCVNEGKPKQVKEFYIQDARSAVGNCASFWAPNGNGYVCDLNQAWVLTEAEVLARKWRDTDVPVPKDEVDAMAIRHARVDNANGLLKLRPPIGMKKRRR